MLIFNSLYQIIKTVTSKIDEVNSYVEKNHPYDVPEVIAMKVTIIRAVASTVWIFSIVYTVR